MVNDVGGRGDLIPRIHPNIERAVPHHAETTTGVFKLPRGNAQIDHRAANCRDIELVENLIREPKICLTHCDATTEARQTFRSLQDRVRILIESENIGAGLQNRLAMTAAA